ncbi:glycosyltransferase family 4 protein [Mycolicibacterium vaccae]|uniref:glycosyltransferase family 4 protein n=1 Tax=Mycolicibacterium vaccae TaxID=1810 RepID=UPI003CF2E4F4
MKLALVGDVSGNRYDLARLGGALAARGHEVEIITASPRPAACDVDVIGIPLEANAGEDFRRPESLTPAISEIGRFLVDRWHREQPDVVHCHDWTYGMAAQLAAKYTPIPTVQSFHGLAGNAPRSTPQAASANRAGIEALLAKNAAMVTVACTDDMGEVIRSGCPRARVSVLPPGVDIDEDAGDGTGDTSGSARQQIVSMTEDLAEHSGADRVVRALPALPGAELTLICADVDRRDLARLHGTADHLGVSGRIRVVPGATGHEVVPHLRGADVVVCPSSYDPRATPALQAMAAGVAVVATETGGPRDAVVADVTGVLVPPGNTEALSRALRSLLGQKVLRQGMGLTGRARVRSRYSWERIATDAEVIYEAALTRVGDMSAR